MGPRNPCNICKRRALYAIRALRITGATHVTRQYKRGGGSMTGTAHMHAPTIRGGTALLLEPLERQPATPHLAARSAYTAALMCMQGNITE